MKYLVAALTLLSYTPSFANDDMLSIAVFNVATAIVYIDLCNVSKDTQADIALGQVIFMDAAGVSFNNKRFKAMTMIKAAELTLVARSEPNFCNLMNAAYEGK